MTRSGGWRGSGDWSGPASFDEIDVVSRYLRVGSLVALFAWFAYSVVEMVRDDRMDHGPTGLPGDIVNWHNTPGNLRWYLVMSVGELLLLLWTIGPRTFHRSWGRAMRLLAWLLPWTLVHIVTMMHAGGIMVVHLVWLYGLCAGALVLLLVSGAGAIRARRRARPNTVSALGAPSVSQGSK